MINILLILNWELQGRLDKKKKIIIIFSTKNEFLGQKLTCNGFIIEQKNQIRQTYIFEVRFFDRDFTSWS